MITKYTRKQINVKVPLHDKKFVESESAEDAIINIIELSIKAGADKEKLMELISNEEVS